MSKAGRTILVVGATGRQGGAVVRHLRKDDWQIRALTRNRQKAEAQALAAQGVAVYQGDMDEPETLPPALAGVWGVYGVQNAWEVGVEREVAEGKALIDAAKAAGAEFFVYSSVGGAERQTGIPHFESKWQIERHLRASGLAHAVIRPVFFMENLLASKEEILAGTWAFGMPEEVPLQMIAVDDIGAFVARAFHDPERWQGRALELAGDELTGPEVCAKLSAALGRTVRYQPIPIEEIAQQNEDWAIMLRWFGEHGYEADIATLRREYPPLMTFDRWVEEQQWA